MAHSPRAGETVFAIEAGLGGGRLDPALLRLLHDASGASGSELEQLERVEIPKLTVLTVREGAVLVAFAAFAVSETTVTIEYLAVDASRRGVGLGRNLIGELVKLHPNETMVAETDDDAVDFYRRLGFTVTPRGSDSRWPDRPRYRCVLPPAGQGAPPPALTLPS
ncbi:MAG TPA: GNAT family N-acetyltransferase [Naasia sp.]|jgi:GNAT superfamily N-acetyltransferase